MDASNKASSKTAAETKKVKLVKKYSHLHLQERHLKKIPKIAPSKDLMVLYLYHNDIRSIENLNNFPNMHSLYLQNNKINKLENLNNLTGLKKLYLGHNRISVLEGLNLENLEELHIEKQSLPDKNPLCFDPRTIYSLSENLQYLDVSHNNITSLSYLFPLRKLKSLNASFNDLDDTKELCEGVRLWHFLKEAKFIGNPLASRHRYREAVIASAYYLESLDGKVVSDMTRTFIRRFEEEKLMNGSRHTINIADVLNNVSKNYPPALQKAVSVSLITKASQNTLPEDKTTFDEKDATHLAWNALPTRKPVLTAPIDRRRWGGAKNGTIQTFSHFPKNM